MTGLEQLVIDLRSGELVVRVLYRSEDGPGPDTKAREVSSLVRTGLEQALEVLAGELPTGPAAVANQLINTRCVQ